MHCFQGILFDFQCLNKLKTLTQPAWGKQFSDLQLAHVASMALGEYVSQEVDKITSHLTICMFPVAVQAGNPAN